MARARLNTVPVPVAMEIIADHLDEQERLGDSLKMGMDGIRMAIEKLDARVAAHDKRKAVWDKFVMTVATGLALAVIVGLYKIAMIVQSSRLPGVAP